MIKNIYEKHYQYFHAILLGQLGFWGSFFAIKFPTDTFSVDIHWSFIFPLLIAMAYGPYYGFISGFFGLGAFSPFILWLDNGWVTLLTSMLYLSWFVYTGHLFQLFQQKKKSDFAFFFFIPFAFFYGLTVYLIFPQLISFSPPPWNPHAHTEMSSQIAKSIALKTPVIMFICLMINRTLLKLPQMRSIFRLKPIAFSQRHLWILSNAILFTTLSWLVWVFFNQLFIADSFYTRPLFFKTPFEGTALFIALSISIVLSGFYMEHFEKRLYAEKKLYDTLREKDLTSKALKRKFDFELLVSDLSAILLSLNYENREEKYKQALSLMGHFFDVDRTYFLANINDRDKLDLLGVWRHPRFKMDAELPKFLAIEKKSWWDKQLKENNLLEIPDMASLPEEYKEMKVFFQSDAIHTLNLSFLSEEDMKGFIALENGLDAKKSSSINEHHLKVISHLFLESHRKIIAEKKLREARIKAEYTSFAKGNYLANMSHEIRTPINGIIGCVELLSRTEDPFKKQHYMHKLQEASEILLHTINDVLDYSKIESGKFKLDKKPFSISETTENICTLLRPQAEKKGISLQYQIDENIPAFVLGDVFRYQQILMNFISNAIKFTHEGGVKVKLMGERKTNKNFFFKLEVKDTGIGIDKDKIQTIFKAFEQVPSYQVQSEKGTGLGLAIAKHLIELMDGEIDVQSKPQKGSSFKVTFLLDIHEDDQMSNTPISSTTINPDLLKKLHAQSILVAEDNEINQLVIKEMLKHFTVNPIVVSNGIEVLKHLEKNHVDIILMDCQMPDLDGFECTQIIRSNHRIHQPHIIAMTAHTMDGDKERCLDSGMNDYLAKPIYIQDLLTLLQKYV